MRKLVRFFGAQAAAARLGALFMPLNWRLAGPEHQQMLNDCPPALLFVDFAGVREVASAITPVPGGVGPLTVTMLLYNTLKAAQLQSLS